MFLMHSQYDVNIYHINVVAELKKYKQTRKV